MRDNDIIKALEACVSGYCLIKKCPLFDLYDGDHDSITKCTSKLAEISLDLIKRQKAEIDNLKAVLNSLREDDDVD